MEVIDNAQGPLTSFEVLNILKEAKAGSSKQKTQSYKTLLYTSTKYLQSRPAAVQTKEGIENLMRALKPFKFTPPELVQIVDLRPTKAVELSLIAEETEARFTEEQEQQILKLVAEHLPKPPQEKKDKKDKGKKDSGKRDKDQEQKDKEQKDKEQKDKEQKDQEQKDQEQKDQEQKDQENKDQENKEMDAGGSEESMDL
uniref:DNA-directed RNA polymerase III subunit RPC9 n=1 Tax=Steinernema glaseri TaxID=37863 RepID=A0A1I7Z626_9BILA